MAIDHALAAAAVPCEAVLRVYGWSSPTVSFGRNEPARGRYDALLDGTGSAAGLDFVRRPTGGRAVLHDRELTYAVVWPLRGVRDLRALYQRVNEALRVGLTRLGVPVETAGSTLGSSQHPNGPPCFVAPAQGELVVRGRKLVGSAQCRVGHALLQHGSILMGGDQDALIEARAERGGGELAERPTTLAEVLGEEPSQAAVMEAVRWGFAVTFAGEWRVDSLRPHEIKLAEQLRRRYASNTWTWRR